MKTVGSKLKNHIILLCMTCSSLILLSCNPVEPYPGVFHSPVDFPYKALENLELAYYLRDMDGYMNCFRNDFEYISVSDLDTLSWGIDTEESIHISLFYNVDIVELTLAGSEEYPWSSDTTGSTLVFPREYDLNVFIEPDSIEYLASGTTHFICRQDSLEEWYVWQWWDFASPGKNSWSDIKALFNPSLYRRL